MRYIAFFYGSRNILLYFKVKLKFNENGSNISVVISDTKRLQIVISYYAHSPLTC